jgi:diaminopropionate ammonia-lyase
MGAPRVVRNPLAGSVPVSPEEDARPLAFHRTLQGYAPTPLVDAPTIAEALGVGRVWVKDESSRLGMPSFKILGASWATYRAACDLLGRDPEPVAALSELRDALSARGPLRLVAATDGNHGRAVARMARLLGLGADVLVPDDMVPARREAIVAEGARVTVVHGTYDDAIARSAELADDTHLVISDTSWPGYHDVPGWVIDGYATIGAELDGQIAARGETAADVLAVQIGVGAFAAAMVRYAARNPRTRVIGVEPVRADCVTASVEAGRLVEVPGPHVSIMAGLNCGNASPVAWPIVSRGIDTLVAIEDEPAREAVRLLSAAGVTAGESGAAGLAGLLWARDALQIPEGATVLLVSTEGATDTEAHGRIVGRPPPAS